MGKLRVKKFPPNGFTLIEVLIALAIISIALTAIIQFTAQDLKNTAYLENKQIANWVALEKLNEARAQLTHFSAYPTTSEEQITLFNRIWLISGWFTPSSNPRIQQLEVTVYYPTKNTPLAHVTGYLYAP